MFYLMLSFALILSPDSWPYLEKAFYWLLNFSINKDAQASWVSAALLISIILAILTLTTFFINTIWEFLFYSILKGYDRPEYEGIKQKLLAHLPQWDEDMKNHIKELPVQPIYGQFLHSFAKQSFIQWLVNRWKTYHLMMSSGIGIFGGVIIGLFILLWYQFKVTALFLHLIWIPIIALVMLIYIGRKRQSELLKSEGLFCLSIQNKNLQIAFDEISKTISSRNIDDNKQTEGLPPHL